MNIFSKEEQIEAIIEGQLFNLLKQRGSIQVNDPSIVDLRSHVTVSRGDIYQFLKKNPSLAQAYFNKHKTTKAGHDIPGIVKENDKYLVFWFDRGKRRDIEEFDDINEAVAAHVLTGIGLY